jgi:hypothetical protein
MSVIIKPKAAYHSIYFGAPCSAPDSIKSKSKTRFIDAIPTTKTENKIPVRPLPNKDPIKEIPKKDRTRLRTYTIKIPKVAEKTPSLKFSVAAISLLLYRNNKAAKIPKVNAIAWFAMPGYIAFA